MKKVKKSRITKHGASSLFLAIVLSSLILIECTFVAFVWNLDYAMSVNEALRIQVETILCDYNRQLFNVYGIYAFSIDGVDGECFRKALEINGLESKSELYISGRTRFTCEDLSKAINSYYRYRGIGIGTKNIVDSCGELIASLDENGYLNRIGEFMRSPAAGYVQKILTGSDKASEWIEKAGDILNIDELSDEADGIDSLNEDYKNAVKDFGLNINLDVADYESFLKTISKIERVQNSLASNSLGRYTRIAVSNYCAYNFDCYFRPDGDSSIIGTSFDEIHSSKHSDVEYFITGNDNVSGVFEVQLLITHLVIAGMILTDYADEKFRNTMEAIAIVISNIILAVSEGSIKIDPSLIAFGLTFFCASIQAIKEVWNVFRGKRAVLFKYEGEKIATFNYRDFLYIFCLYVPVNTLLERSLSVLERDYGELYTGITLEADYRGQTYSATKSYRLYD